MKNIKKYINCFVFLIVLSFFITDSVELFAYVDKSLPSLEGEYGKWKVFSVEQNDRKVCYALTTPVDLSGNHRDNRSPYIMVSLFGGVKYEVSISAGYYYKPNSIVSVSIDGKQERFIAEHETIAFVEKNNNDKQVVNEMENGFKMLVFSESQASTYSVDTYSLSGFKQSLKKIRDLCIDK